MANQSFFYPGYLVELKNIDNTHLLYYLFFVLNFSYLNLNHEVYAYERKPNLSPIFTHYSYESKITANIIRLYQLLKTKI